MGEKETETKKRSLKEYFYISLKGAAMGSANIIPGVSGGTMALILGIYEELINSVKTFTSVDTIKMLLGFKIKEAWNNLPWRFLAAIAIGVVIAGLSLVKVLKVALDKSPVLVWAFFFGLVLASILTITKRVKKWNAQTIIGAIAGAAGAFFLVGLIPTETPDSWWFLIICGAIAMSAMILPGISGSFILLLLSKYEFIITAISNIMSALKKGQMFELNDFMILVWVGIGCILGLLSLVQLLSWLFKKHHDLTVAILIGFMAGSLRKIWPWREVLKSVKIGDKVKVLEDACTWPASFSGEFYMAVALIITGFAAVIIMEFMASKKDKAAE